MGKVAGIIAGSLIGIGLTAHSASALDCTCRYAGQKFHLGEIVCIGGGSGGRLAQCQMNLNNTSWKILAPNCPSASAPPAQLSTSGTSLAASTQEAKESARSQREATFRFSQR